MKLAKKVLLWLILGVFCLANLSVLNFTLAARTTADEQQSFDDGSKTLQNPGGDSWGWGARRNNWWWTQNQGGGNWWWTSSSNWRASLSVYTSMLSATLQNPSLRSAEFWDQIEDMSWARLVNRQIIKLIGYAIDVFIAIWVAIAFIGWYKIMFSDKEDAYKEWIKILYYGVVWIIVMVSAKFIASWFVWDDGIVSTNRLYRSNISDKPSGIFLAQNLYEKIMYPFIKIALYILVGVLFFIMVGKVVTFAISSDDAAKKKAWWIILWTAIWMFIMLWAKQMVEAVFWNQDKILNYEAKYINEVAADTLEFWTVPIVSQIINWVMWLTTFIVLVLVVIQAYRIFAKPDDPKNRERIKKTLLYVVIWVLVIGAAYVVSSLLVINHIPETTM